MNWTYKSATQGTIICVNVAGNKKMISANEYLAFFPIFHLSKTTAYVKLFIQKKVNKYYSP